MSVTFTERAVVERRKTVTRRKGWTFLKPGDRLTLCRKVQGRKRKDGTVEQLVRLAEVEVVSVRREALERLTMEDPWAEDADHQKWIRDELRREGFPGWSGEDFVEKFFIKAQKIYPSHDVTRIEWRYLDEVES
jgi:hypothetical protein